MDTSFLSPGPITWAQIVPLAALLFALGNGADWVIGKLRAATKDAASPFTTDMAAVKIQVAAQNEVLQ
ncbi:hypothetical protein ACTHQZ_16840 [Methylorubrum thiocyanatum]